tara:strand:+ start:45675 stop:46301 length:627 start_codon:yes stop_codon:yes gene_type:complete
MAEEIENDTNTELKILKNIEKAFYRNNESAKKRNTQKSLKWFSKYVPRSYNKARTAQMFRDRDLFSKRIKVGQMHFFQYDAKHKDKLPVWDMYPLVFFFDSYRAKDGAEILLGINLHYLKPSLRFEAMRTLLKYRNEKRYRPSTRLKISWQVLKSLGNSKLFEHSIKAYRMDHVRSQFVQVPPRSWELVIFLPLARWQKGSKSTAWKI